jgi:hypothetical protein
MSINWSKTQLSLRPIGDEELQVALAFQALWKMTQEAGANVGWRSQNPSRVEVEFTGNEDSLASVVWVSPYKRDRFIVRITPATGAFITPVRAALESVVVKLTGAEMSSQRAPRSSGAAEVIEVRSTWEDVIGDDDPSSSTVEKRLHGFVAPILLAIPRK